ncbi:hypothetical protein FK529_05495 [Tsukamurella asaccharolytica]|uniref:Head-to-tail stopper n=1 Tax=Tsukamurella asaccharolytica TaxID=2592067 RepID=A0A5C5RCY0_9ACTN|nr:hypothetical protein [Tsukamurella asaccharolytica]TWS20780.1 hypothetical protein FK529_05495 [Tsukamurella asaccharolytica]
MPRKFPTPHTVAHGREVIVGKNALNQPIVEFQWVPRAVYGWQPKFSVQGTQQAALGERAITEQTLMTPDADWEHGDRVRTPDGREWQINGEPEDYTHGPFKYAPGYAFTIRRVVDGKA